MNIPTSKFAVIGRILIAALFLPSGIGKIAAPEMTLRIIELAGIPAPIFCYVVAVIIEVGVCLSLVIGYRTQVAALILASFSVVTALVFHSNFDDQNQLIHFLKNIAIAGGLLQVAAFGAASFSVDAHLLHAAQRRTDRAS